MQSSLFVVCLSVCLLASLRKNFKTDLHKIFKEGWQWVNEQTIKFWWPSGSRIRVRIRIRIRITDADKDPDPYRDTGKICLGGGMHYPSASSLLLTSRIKK